MNTKSYYVLYNVLLQCQLGLEWTWAELRRTAHTDKEEAEKLTTVKLEKTTTLSLISKTKKLCASLGEQRVEWTKMDYDKFACANEFVGYDSYLPGENRVHNLVFRWTVAFKNLTLQITGSKLFFSLFPLHSQLGTKYKPVAMVTIISTMRRMRRLKRRTAPQKPQAHHRVSSGATSQLVLST